MKVPSERGISYSVDANELKEKKSKDAGVGESP